MSETFILLRFNFKTKKKKNKEIINLPRCTGNTWCSGNVGATLTFEQLRICEYIDIFYGVTINVLCSESLIFEAIPA